VINKMAQCLVVYARIDTSKTKRGGRERQSGEENTVEKAVATR
jgi:hypothetical protein